VQALRPIEGGGGRGIALPFMTMTLEGGEGSASRPGCSLHPGKTRYQLYRRLGEPQGRSGQVRKISTLREFDPRIVQPIASLYTDYATRSTDVTVLFFIHSSNSCALYKIILVKLYQQIPGTFGNSYSCLKVLKESYKPKTNVNRRSTTSFIARFSKL
jgi:hypothetical protein